MLGRVCVENEREREREGGSVCVFCLCDLISFMIEYIIQLNNLKITSNLITVVTLSSVVVHLSR